MCKPHTTAENLIPPATIDMVKAVIGSEDVRKIKAIPLSNSTVSRRTDEMADDICEQLIQKIKGSDFIATQFHELTDVLDLARRKICFFASQYMVIQQDNASLISFLRLQAAMALRGKKCIAICSDGTKGITGKKSGLTLKLKPICQLLYGHIASYTDMLSFQRRCGLIYTNLLSEAIRIVNFIKSRPLQSRLISTLCE
jgi:hypothetical protein